MSHSPRHPHDDLRELIREVPPLERRFADGVRERLARFPGPDGVLGDLGERLEWLAMCQKRPLPLVERPLVAVFAGTHSAVDGDVTARAQERVLGVTQGSAAVRGIAASVGAAFKVYEFGLELPAADMREGASLAPRDTAAAFAFGMEVVAEGADVVALGSIGVGAATAAAAIARGLYGGSEDYWARGEGDVGAARQEAVRRAAAANAGRLDDPLKVLSAFGGRDIAGLAGAITAARYQAIPVVLDGFVTCAAAAVLHAVEPNSVAHCLAAQVSGEFGQGALLSRMGMEALHHFDIGVGDGTGAAIAVGTLKAACAGLTAL